MRRFLLVFLCVAACKTKGASKGQSFHDGVQALCSLPDHVPATSDSYEKRLAGVLAWANANITNPEAKSLGSVGTGKDALVAAAQQEHVEPCKLVDNGMALQSFSDGMQAVCAAPSTADPAYYQSHLLNPEVIGMFSALGNSSPAERMAKMQAAVAKAGLGGCALLEKMAAKTIEHAPTVTGVGLAELAPRAVSVIATPSAITVEGKTLVGLANGAVPADELDNQVLKHIDKFLAALATQVQTAGALPRVQLVVDPTVPATLLEQLVATADHAGFKDLGLVVNADGASRVIPFARATKPATGLQLVVAIGDKLSVYSLSGQEGTAQQPKATVATPGELAAALSEIATRRFKPGQRTDDDRRIDIAAEPAVPVQRVAEVLALVRANKDGSELFPRIYLK